MHTLYSQAPGVLRAEVGPPPGQHVLEELLGLPEVGYIMCASRSLSLSLSLYIYIYIHTYTYVYMHIHMCLHIYIYIYIYMHNTGV